MSNKILIFSINPEDIIKCKDFTNNVVNQTYNRFNKELNERKLKVKVIIVNVFLILII